ncbi:hypothetical protein OHA88_11495 [Streptomyces sp. NBC_00353]|uniref:hypothetical protein n=1 Tax=Streptomyces sp. NBC_00353 TaxID=2975722 RepID=UPI002E2754D4
MTAKPRGTESAPATTVGAGFRAITDAWGDGYRIGRTGRRILGQPPLSVRQFAVPVRHRTLLVTAVERTVPDVTGRAFALFPDVRNSG